MKVSAVEVARFFNTERALTVLPHVVLEMVPHATAGRLMEEELVVRKPAIRQDELAVPRQYFRYGLLVCQVRDHNRVDRLPRNLLAFLLVKLQRRSQEFGVREVPQRGGEEEGGITFLNVPVCVGHLPGLPAIEVGDPDVPVPEEGDLALQVADLQRADADRGEHNQACQ